MEIKFYGAFVLILRVNLHAIDATPARWRGDAGSSPLDRARTAAKHPTHWSISTQAETIRPMARAGFIPLFATFPVDYLDEDLCVFVFPLFGTRIVAVREGSAIARDLREIVVTD